MVAGNLQQRVAEWVNIPAFLAVALWGSTYVVIKIAVRDHFTPLNLAAMRLVLGAIVLFLILLILEKDWRIERKDIPMMALLGLTGLAAFQILFIEGLKYTTASNSSVVVSTSPIFAAITILITRVDNLRWRTAAGIVLAFGGVALVAQREGLRLGQESGLLGDIFTLLAAISWGFFVAVQTPILRRHSPLKVMTYATIFGSVFVLPFTAGDLLAQDWGAVSLEGWGLGIYYVIASGVVATILWSRGIRNWGPAKTSVYSYLNPFFGIVSGMLFLGERLVAVQVVGTLAIFMGLALARK